MSALTDHGKSQGVRLWDVLVLGPALIWLGTRQRKTLSGPEALALAWVGAGVILYNGRNFVRIAQAQRLTKPAPDQSLGV